MNKAKKELLIKEHFILKWKVLTSVYSCSELSSSRQNTLICLRLKGGKPQSDLLCPGTLCAHTNAFECLFISALEEKRVVCDMIALKCIFLVVLGKV